MRLFANWTICGVVSQKRELTSQKNKDWRGYVVKVATLGQTYEVQVDREQYNKLGEGEHIEFTGKFEEQNNVQRFIVENWKPLGNKGAA